MDGKIIDMAISMALLGGVLASEPILLGKNIRNGMEPIIEYGVPSRGIEGESLIVMNLSFTDYMGSFPDEKTAYGVLSENCWERKSILRS